MLANHRFGGTELRRRLPGQSLENAIKLRKRLKSRRERDVTNAQTAVMEKVARFFKSGACDVIDKVHPSYLLESFAEIVRVNVDRFRHRPEGKFFTRMFLDKLARFPNLHRFSSVS